MTTPLRLVFLGAPGSGKGTQARILEERFGVRQISTGDILRRHRAEKTSLGMEAQEFMDRGELVPDDLIIKMMEEELPREGGFILDGFPRTVAQAEALDALLARLRLPLGGVIYFDAPRSELFARLAGRWTNPRTGRVYHERYSPPRVAGVDDEDGGPLVQRADDTPETVEHRLDVFDRETAPLVAYFERRGELVRVDALRSVEDVTKEILEGLEGRDGAVVA